MLRAGPALRRACPRCRRAAAALSAAAAAPPASRRDWRRAPPDPGRGHGGTPLALPPRPRSAEDEEGGAVLLSAASRLRLSTVCLSEGKARLFWDGNPIVFGGAVGSVSPPDPPQGAPVVVCDHRGSAFAWGVWNEASLYRVRLLGSARDAARAPALACDVAATLRARLAAAVALRARLGLGLASPASEQQKSATTAYRLINSEGDRLSGLTADVFGPFVVVACSAAWAQHVRARVASAFLDALPRCDALFWRPAGELLKREGYVEARGAADADNAPPVPQPEVYLRAPSGAFTAAAAVLVTPAQAAALPQSVVVTERGVRYTVSLEPGQKTGFYCDQRDNRSRVAAIVAAHASAAAAAAAEGGDSVPHGGGGGDGSEGEMQQSPPPPLRLLDLCCYTGGFAVAAAAASGGRGVVAVGVDSSAPAVARATANAALNGLDPSACSFVAADALAYLAAHPTPKFDIVVLDPPKLAPTRGDLPAAARMYARLNAAAARALVPGGLLVTCTCSGAVTQAGKGAFEGMVAGAIASAGRGAVLLESHGAAPCHARLAAYPEGEYLTCAFFAVE